MHGTSSSRFSVHCSLRLSKEIRLNSLTAPSLERTDKVGRILNFSTFFMMEIIESIIACQSGAFYSVSCVIIRIDMSTLIIPWSGSSCILFIKICLSIFCVPDTHPGMLWSIDNLTSMEQQTAFWTITFACFSYFLAIFYLGHKTKSISSISSISVL